LIYSFLAAKSFLLSKIQRFQNYAEAIPMPKKTFGGRLSRTAAGRGGLHGSRHQDKLIAQDDAGWGYKGWS